VARTHQFRLIGNAVPPLVAEAVGCEIKEFLGAPSSGPARIETNSRTQKHAGSETGAPMAQTRQAAACELQQLAQLDRRGLRALPTEQFLHGWRALLFLFPDLHPDNALDHGNQIEEVSPDQLALPGFDELVSRRYSRSGWPVALELIGNEAWRRFDAGELAQPEFYCVEAQRAGLRFSAPAKTLEHQINRSGIEKVES
jgi:DNA (cytosine-5)-methyltransferase 1